MSSDRKQKIAQIVAHRRPRLVQIDAALERLSETERQLTKVGVLTASTLDRTSGAAVASVGALNVELLLGRVQRAKTNLTKLRARFARTTINLGVVGLAGQGKSRFLQSVSSLTSREIPDGDGWHCTGVRSVVHHAPSDPHARVWFHSEATFLAQVLAPYYEALGLGAVPSTLLEFGSQPLPSLPERFATLSECQAKYEHLVQYRKRLPSYAPLLRTESPRRIGLEQVREFVAQSTADGQPVYSNFFAVDHVDIFCAFPQEDLGAVAVMDMPGLGDTGIGDEARLIRTLAHDVDVVLFVRRPDARRPVWTDVDVKLHDLAKSAIPELPLEQWSFMVLNHLPTSVRGGGNDAGCAAMAAALNSTARIDVARCMVVNCADDAAVRATVLDPVLDYLAQHLDVLDTRFASACDAELRQLARELRAFAKTARHTIGRHAAFEGEHLQFRELFRAMWKDLTTGLESTLRELKQATAYADTRLAAATDAALEAARSEPGIPDAERIQQLRDREGGYLSAYEHCLHVVRIQLVQHFVSLESTLQGALDDARGNVAAVLRQRGRLRGVIGDGLSLAELADSIPQELSALRTAFDALASVQLTYRGFLQYRVRQHLERLMTDVPHHAEIGSVRSLRELLEVRYRQTLFDLEGACREWCREPNLVAHAVVEEFVDRALRAEGVEDEWEAFYLQRRHDVWPDDFRKVQERARLSEEWKVALDAIETDDLARGLSGAADARSGKAPAMQMAEVLTW